MYIEKGNILDGKGRTLILRGVNLGGDSKNPIAINKQPGWTMLPQSLENSENVSFVGRPFPVEDAQKHFGILQKAGFTFLRLVLTWEALEHSWPGQYDEEFIDYLKKILIAAKEKDIYVFIDPHQDVWSRWTGGDGAPAWTLEKIGINLDKIDVTAAAITKQHYGDLHKTAKYPEGKPFPKMIWPGNYNRYAVATMFSLFFAGKTYAPSLSLDGKNIQDWLQDHYIAAFCHCYNRLKECSAIAGWGIMNEPSAGFIGYRNLENVENNVMPIGPRPTAWDTMLAASGHAVEVPVYRTLPIGKPGKDIFNSRKQMLFREGFCCPWKQAGVWTDEGGEARLLRKDHFAMFEGRPADFMNDFHKPFLLRFINAQKAVNKKTLFFIEGTPPGQGSGSHPEWNTADAERTANAGVVNAFHWYDGFSLFLKWFNDKITMNPENAKTILGHKNVQDFFNNCLAKSADWSKEHMGGAPSLLAEFGLPFDMNGRRAYRSGNYSMHETALSMYYDAVDANLMHSTLWNYSAGNTNKYGDGWNDEDLSIFSEGRERAAAGWKRPYPMATAGKPLLIKWQRKKNIFQYRFIVDSSIGDPTVIYLPDDYFTENTEVSTPLRFELRHEEQRLFVFNDGKSGEIEVLVRGR
jgi:hypothetical protein